MTEGALYLREQKQSPTVALFLTVAQCFACTLQTGRGCAECVLCEEGLSSCSSYLNSQQSSPSPALSLLLRPSLGPSDLPPRRGALTCPPSVPLPQFCNPSSSPATIKQNGRNWDRLRYSYTFLVAVGVTVSSAFLF